MAREIRLVTVGKTRRVEFRDSITTYLARMNPWVKGTWQVIQPQSGDPAKESRAILEALDGVKVRPWTVLCDSTGKMVDSVEWARLLGGWLEASGGGVAVVVGGASGVDQRVKERADWCWSLGPLTLPHGLAQVIVAEQLYRALTIWQGHPYHTGH